MSFQCILVHIHAWTSPSIVKLTHVAGQYILHAHRDERHSDRCQTGTAGRVCWAGTGSGTHSLCQGTFLHSCTGLNYTRWCPLHICLLLEKCIKSDECYKRHNRLYTFQYLLVSIVLILLRYRAKTYLRIQGSTNICTHWCHPGTLHTRKGCWHSRFH